NRDHFLKITVMVEHLDAAIPAVCDVNVAFRIGGDTVRRVELTGLCAPRIAPRFYPVPILVELRNARVDVAVADKNVALWIPCHVCRLAELSVDGGSRGIDACPRSAFIRRFLLTSEYHRHAAFGIELDDHVGAFVDGPDIVFSVDSNRMRK